MHCCRSHTHWGERSHPYPHPCTPHTEYLERKILYVYHTEEYGSYIEYYIKLMLSFLIDFSSIAEVPYSGHSEMWTLHDKEDTFGCLNYPVCVHYNPWKRQLENMDTLGAELSSAPSVSRLDVPLYSDMFYNIICFTSSVTDALPVRITVWVWVDTCAATHATVMATATVARRTGVECEVVLRRAGNKHSPFSSL